MNNIAIFASGSGSNAQNIIEYFSNSSLINVKLVAANNPNAYVIRRAKRLQVDTFVFNKVEFQNPDIILNKLRNYDTHWIVLAGFLWLIPEYLVQAFPGKIINIHPALLPKYGGKGMYGMNVHRAVIDNNEKESGITIHYVNNEYDRGKIIHQSKAQILETDTAESLAEKIHKLEYEHFPKVIEQLVCEAQE